MRKTLEDFYYGNLRPFEQQMTVSTELQRAVDAVTKREKQLLEQLDDEGKNSSWSSPMPSRRRTVL